MFLQSISKCQTTRITGNQDQQNQANHAGRISPMRVTRITVAIVGDNVDKKSEPGAVSDRSGIQDESDLKPKPPNWKNATAQKSSLGPGRYRFGSDI